MSIEEKLRSAVQAVDELWADPVDTAERLARLQDRVAAEQTSSDGFGPSPEAEGMPQRLLDRWRVDSATQSGLVLWLREYAAFHLQIPDTEIDPRVPLFQYGMDSLIAVKFANGLKEEFGFEISPTLLYDHPTLDGLGVHLAAMLSNASAGASSQGAGEGRAGGPYFLTVAEVASIMKISNRAVYQLVHNGHLPALRVREEYRVSTDAVQEYLRETEAQLISLPKAPFRLRVMPPSRHGSRSAPGSS